MFSYQTASVTSILETSLDAVFTVDAQGTIVDVNSAAVRLFGWSRDELIGANVACIVAPPYHAQHDDFVAAYDAARGVTHVLGSGQRLDGVRKDGTRLPVEVAISSFEQDGRRYFAGFVRDMSERQRAEDRFRHLATHDAETGLLNPRGFGEQPVALDDDRTQVVFVRFDELGRLLSAYSRKRGTFVLQEVTLRLREFAAPHETIARIREDAFAVVFPRHGERRAALLHRLLGRPVMVGTMDFPLTVTMGISRSIGTLVQRLNDAQLACDALGAAGQGRINVCDDAVLSAAQRERQLETRLREVLHQGGLGLALQPKIDLATRRIVGAEALVRWHDEQLGSVSPGEFIPIAERLGLIGRITQWVLHSALDEAAQFAGEAFTVAVNFSALDFLQADLPTLIGDALKARGVDAGRLVVELTESVVANDPQAVRARMHEIKALGAAISLDDFGTGYSSLSYLRQFPIDSLKIDASFVRDLPDQADAVAVAQAIVSLARALDLESIAEGVEAVAQARLLGELGVDLAQGYLFSPPVSPAQWRALVAAQR